MLSQQAKYLWKLLDHYWGCGITKKDLVEVYGYPLDELHDLYKELRAYHLVRETSQYNSTLRVYRAEFDRRGVIDGKEEMLQSSTSEEEA